MFVSSYSTYINTNTTDKTSRSRVEIPKDGSKSFSSALSKTPVEQSTLIKNLPVDYVSNNRSFSTQKKIEDQAQHKESVKFQKVSDIKSAQVAYSENSVMFSLLQKPGISLDYTETINKNLPQDIQDIKEENLKRTMVNTYIENENYYKVTA